MAKRSDERSMSHNSWESWCVNVYFFFWTGSQTILWPWSPVILKEAGLDPTGAGVALLILTLSSILSVYVSQRLVNKTKNGSVRRLLLFGMSASSSIFSFASVLMLPDVGKEYFCSSYGRSAAHHDFGTFNNSTWSRTDPQWNITVPNVDEVVNLTFQSFGEISMRKNDTSTFFEILLTTPTFYASTRSPNAAQNSATSQDLYDDKEKTTESNNFHFANNLSQKDEDDENRSGRNDESQSNYSVSKIHSFSKVQNTGQVHGSNGQPGFQHETLAKEPFQHHHSQNGQNKLDGQRNGKPNIPSKANENKNYRISFDNNHDSPAFHSDNDPMMYPEIPDSLPGFQLTKYQQLKPQYKRIFQNRLKRRDVQNFSRQSPKIQQSISRHSSSYGIGVSTILILGMTLGAGIEAAVSKIWYMIRYGSSQENDDIIEVIIRPPLYLSVLGEHRHWCLLTSSLWIILPAMFIGSLCQLGVSVSTPLIVMGIFHGLTAVMSSFTLLFVPMPYGSLRNCITKRRPLSLYLDDEVIHEGLRRVFFHFWVIVCGFLASLPTFFTVWLLQESSPSNGQVFASQLLSIIGLLFGEGVLYPSGLWLNTKLNIQVTMILTTSLLWCQCLLAYVIQEVWIRGTSLLLVGYSTNLLWIAIRKNAILLGTSADQEKEATASWVCLKIGTAIGGLSWASMMEMGWSSGSVQNLLLPAAVVGILVTTCIVLVSLLMYNKYSGRRRIYHTLDLTCSDDDEEVTDDGSESDWLVKRAKKEGLKL